MPDVLEQIKNSNDIKRIDPKNYKQLAKEIRHFIIEKISKKGGHLASNLGVVELTMALHLWLHFPEDKLIWDVGHQSYTHKILTGRKEQFASLRMYGGMSGFPKREESESDCFETGHSSTSISAALGFAKARDITGKKNKVVAVIGDGALSGGMAYEALNNAARLKSNLIIILNDNNMSISENVGGMAAYLGKIRTSQRYLGLKEGVENAIRKVPRVGEAIIEKIRRSKDSIKRLVLPGMLFEDMGITYIGPIDGHDIGQLLDTFHSAEEMQEAVLIHVVTKKGKGYSRAEKNPSRFHGVEPFHVKTGESKSTNCSKTYTAVFSDTMMELAENNPKITAITAAMPEGTGLVEFAKAYPERFFDVGIAEEHAVTFAAGLAADGCKPFVAVYSTFLQRAFDQILHDVCISNLPVVFAVDRGGIVGKDGETHQGIFDLSYLSMIPNLAVAAPKNAKELTKMLQFAAGYHGAIAIRYPRGAAYEGLENFLAPIELGKSECICRGYGVALLAIGNMVETALEVKEYLKEDGIEATIINARFVSPLDEEMLRELLDAHDLFVTMEENIRKGGFGEKVSSFLCLADTKKDILNISIPDCFIKHGEVNELKEKLGLDAKSIYQQILAKRKVRG